MSTNQTTRTAIGRHVRSERQARGMDAEALGEETGVHRDTIYRLERGECRNPGVCKIEKIAGVFGQSLSEFFESVEEIKEHV